MKAILKFNLPEEREEFELASNAAKYSIVLSDIDNHLRSKIKHADLTDEQYEVYEEVRKQLWEYIQDQGIQL
jgi:small-conductance mechanosensitive channel